MTFASRQLCALALTLCAAAGAQAADGIRPVIGLDFTFGGDTLVSVPYTNGDTKNIKAGGLVHFFGGAEYQSGNFALQGTVGYHRDSTAADNGSVTFTRVPVEVLGLWTVGEQVRLGGGLRKSTGAKQDSSGAASLVGRTSYTGNLGVVVQGEYLFVGSQLSAFVRYVSESYESRGARVDGNHFGLGLSYRF